MSSTLNFRSTLSNLKNETTMNQRDISQWEEIIQETAATLVYPPTPDIAGRVHSQIAGRMHRPGAHRPGPAGKRRFAPPASGRPRLAWSLVLLLALIIGSLLVVPELRAALLRVLQIGPIRVFVDETLPEPTATVVPATATPAATAAAQALTTRLAATVTPNTATPPPPAHSLALASLGTPVTLARAQEAVGFPLLSPGYPEEVGEADEVYLHFSAGGTAVTQVWRYREQSNEVWFSLTQIEQPEFEFALKWARAEDVVELQIDGRRAIWVRGPHRIALVEPELVSPIHMASNVLIWTDGDMTFRLEGDIELEEASKIVESLNEQ
jgi:hypothetical protein